MISFLPSDCNSFESLSDRAAELVYLKVISPEPGFIFSLPFSSVAPASLYLCSTTSAYQLLLDTLDVPVHLELLMGSKELNTFTPSFAAFSVLCAFRSSVTFL